MFEFDLENYLDSIENDILPQCSGVIINYIQANSSLTLLWETLLWELYEERYF